MSQTQYLGGSCMSQHEAEGLSAKQPLKCSRYLKSMLSYVPRWYEDILPERGRWLMFPICVFFIPFGGALQVKYVIEDLHLPGSDYAAFIYPINLVLLSLLTTYFLIPRWHVKFSLFLCVWYTIFTVLSGVKFLYGYNFFENIYLIFSFMLFFSFHVKTSAYFWGSLAGIPVAFAAYALMPKSKVRFWQSEP